MIKNILLIASLASLLSACCPDPVKPDPSVVTRTEYVVRQAPADMYQLPPQVVNLDTNKATQKEIAKWIATSEDRNNTLERMIQALQVYFNAPVAATEVPKK
jgi:hypothetical protein